LIGPKSYSSPLAFYFPEFFPYPPPLLNPGHWMHATVPVYLWLPITPPFVPMRTSATFPYPRIPQKNRSFLSSFQLISLIHPPASSALRIPVAFCHSIIFPVHRCRSMSQLAPMDYSLIHFFTFSPIRYVGTPLRPGAVASPDQAVFPLM